jgi:hypothetical protein
MNKAQSAELRDAAIALLHDVHKRVSDALLSCQITEQTKDDAQKITQSAVLEAKARDPLLNRESFYVTLEWTRDKLTLTPSIALQAAIEERINPFSGVTMNAVQMGHALAVRKRAKESGLHPDGFTIEHKGDSFVVYGWGEYEESSVLAGQTRKSYIQGFDTEADARIVWPEIGSETHSRSAHNSVSHLPGPDDMVPGGALPDDYE